jgi:hypothetical protein
MIPKPENVPNEHKMYQMVIKYPKCPYNIPNGRKIYPFFNLMPSKIYPNWEFWFENKPSGNPGKKVTMFSSSSLLGF